MLSSQFPGAGCSHPLCGHSWRAHSQNDFIIHESDAVTTISHYKKFLLNDMFLVIYFFVIYFFVFKMRFRLMYEKSVQILCGS